MTWKASLGAALLAALVGCSAADSRASKAAATLDLGLPPMEVRKLLGSPDRIRYVSPNVEEWYYRYTEERRRLLPGRDPHISWDAPPDPRLVVRFENREVAGWRRP